MKGQRYREGKLTTTEIDAEGADELDDTLGTIAGLRDFLDKATQLRKAIVAPPGSLRDGYVRQIEYLTAHVERFLRGPHNSPQAEHALLSLLHAACEYMHLLAELADDAANGERRGKYLQARAMATHSRKKMADLAGFQSLQAMIKFEDSQGLPRARRAPRKSRPKRR